jgi:hypothetical protein
MMRGRGGGAEVFDWDISAGYDSSAFSGRRRPCRPVGSDGEMQSYLRAPAKVAPRARVTRAERLVADRSAKREVRVCKRGESGFWKAAGPQGDVVPVVLSFTNPTWCQL